MKIVYNPKDGAPIRGFMHKGILLDPHLPDGYKTEDGTIATGYLQYEDEVADNLLETYAFLSESDAQAVEERLQKVTTQEEFKCTFPGCDFSTTARVALFGHAKSHGAEFVESLKKGTNTPPQAQEAPVEPQNAPLPVETPVVNESLVPVAGGHKVNPVRPNMAAAQEANDETQDGTDKDGVEWYGGGADVQNRSQEAFGATRPQGQGHFKG